MGGGSSTQKYSYPYPGYGMPHPGMGYPQQQMFPGYGMQQPPLMLPQNFQGGMGYPGLMMPNQTHSSNHHSSNNHASASVAGGAHMLFPIPEEQYNREDEVEAEEGW